MREHETSKGAYSEVASARQPTDSKVAPDLFISGVAKMECNMGIIRREKSENYSVIYNECFQRSDISARAKGLFAYLMTLPDDWKIYKSELKKHFTEGRDALSTALDELESAGYITKTPQRGEGGKLRGWDYTVYESTELLKNRNTENPSDGKPATTNNLLEINTNNTNCSDSDESSAPPESSNKKQKAEGAGAKRQKYAPPALDEVLEFARKYAESDGLSPAAVLAKAKQAFDYYEKNMRVSNARTWKKGNGDTVKNWKLTIANNWLKDVDTKAGGSGYGARM